MKVSIKLNRAFLSVRSLILDEPAPWWELVLTALETGDTSHRPDSVPGISDDILTKGNGRDVLEPSCPSKKPMRNARWPMCI
jgi:hypothetical protein